MNKRRSSRVACCGVVMLLALVLLATLVLPSAPPAAAAAGSNYLASGERLFRDTSLVSPNGRYVLVMQSDGNLVVYGPGNIPLWASNTSGRPGAFLVNQGDGNLVVYSGAGAPLWHSGTYGRGASTLRMQDDGNLVLYKDGGGSTWASGTVQAAPPSAIPTSPNTAAFGAQVLNLLNARRQQYSCQPVNTNQLLQNAAQRHAVDMATYRYLSHTGRDGSTFGDRVAREGYRFASLGEILAQGQTTPESVVVAWMESPVHRDIILTCGYREIGIGYSDNGHYWVAEFGTP